MTAPFAVAIFTALVVALLGGGGSRPTDDVYAPTTTEATR